MSVGICNFFLEYSVNQLITGEGVSLSFDEYVYANTRSTGINVTFIPENVTSGTHSIAQNSIAQHSIAQKSKEKPLLNPPLKKTGEEAVKEEGKEEEFSGISRTVSAECSQQAAGQNELTIDVKSPVKNLVKTRIENRLFMFRSLLIFVSSISLETKTTQFLLTRKTYYDYGNFVWTLPVPFGRQER